jgi:type II secretory pathway pseudopilin PulG
MFLEILFSNVIVILVGLAVLVVERWLDRQTFNRGFKAVTAALFVISVSLFVIFTQRLPWCDVFADPTLIP